MTGPLKLEDLLGPDSGQGISKPPSVDDLLGGVDSGTPGRKFPSIPVEAEQALGATYGVGQVIYGSTEGLLEQGLDLITGGRAEIVKDLQARGIRAEPTLVERMLRERANARIAEEGTNAPRLFGAGPPPSLLLGPTPAELEGDVLEAKHGFAGTPRRLFDLTAGQITSLFQLKDAHEQAPTAFDRAAVIGQATGMVGLAFAPLAKGKVTPGLHSDILTNPTQFAQARVYADLKLSPFTREAIRATLEPGVTPGANLFPQASSYERFLNAANSAFRARPVPTRAIELPIEGEQFAIKQRLLNEEAGNLTSAIIRAHEQTNKYGTTVIPGVTEPSLAINRARELNPSIGVALHRKATNDYDLAIYNEQSPLAASEELHSQFRQFGFFEGEEVFVNGAPAVFMDALQLASGERFALIKPLGVEGVEAAPKHVNLNEIRRASNSSMDAPFIFEQRLRDFTINEAIDYFGAERLPGDVAMGVGATSPDLLAQAVRIAFKLDAPIAIEGMFTDPFSGIKLKPGINRATITAEQGAIEVGDLGVGTAEPTTYVYADITGKPIALMQLESKFNLAWPGTYKQLYPHTGQPSMFTAQVVPGKQALSIDGIIYDAARSDRDLARATIALAEEAKRLGVTQVTALVDAPIGRVLARYLNKYVGKKSEITNARYRTGTLAIDTDALFNDYRAYRDNVTSSPENAARLTGIDLSGSKVRDAQGNLVRVYHGTTRSFDQFDMGMADPEALVGPGAYFTDAAKVSNGYAEQTIPTISTRVLRTQAEAQSFFESLLENQKVIEAESLLPGQQKQYVQPRQVATGDWVVDYFSHVDPSNIRPAYLNIKNPFDMEAVVTPETVARIKDIVYKRVEQALINEDIAPQDVGLAVGVIDEAVGRTNWDLYNTIDNAYDFIVQGRSVRGRLIGAAEFADFKQSVLKEVGFDGIRYDGGKRIPMMDENGQPILHNVWVAFSPDQIVSPWIGASGTFDNILAKFAKERGFTPEEIPYLRNYLLNREAKQLRELYLTPDELESFKQAEKTVNEFNGVASSKLEALQFMRENKGSPLSYLATSNNLSAEWMPAGVIEIRTLENGRHLLGRFRTEQAARDFLNSQGQASGPDLDIDLMNMIDNLPPGAFVSDIMPPSPPPPHTNSHGGTNIPPDPLSFTVPGERKNTINDVFSARLGFLRDIDKQIQAHDNFYGTSFYGGRVNKSGGWIALDEGNRRVNAALAPWVERIFTEIDRDLRGMSIQRRTEIFRAVEQLSADEVRDIGFHRPLNPREIKLSQALAKRNIDTSRVAFFTRKWMEIEERFPGADNLERVKLALADLAGEMKMDKVHLEAANIFKAIRESDIDEIYLGHVVRYTDALMSNAPTRSSLMNTLNFSAKERGLVVKLDKILDDAGNYLGIPHYRRINGYISHFASTIEPTTSVRRAFFDQPGLDRIPAFKFANELARTGELNHVVMDPAIAVLRYVRSGIMSKEFYPTLRNVIKDWAEQVQTLPPEARPIIERTLKNYIDDVRGIPDADVKFTQDVIDRFMEGIGSKTTVDARRQIVNNTTSLMSGSTMAFRPIMGVRDWITAKSVSYARFGLKVSNRMVELYKSMTPEAMAAMHDRGLIPQNPSIVSLSTPVEQGVSAIQSGAGRATELLNKMTDLGMRASLQPTIYERWHAGAYLEGRERALNAIKEYSIGKLTIQQLGEQVILEAYKPSFRSAFLELIRNNKFEDAAHIFGQETGRMVLPVYGMANHPHYWNTNTGRLFFHFGKYPSWLFESLGEMATRGSRSYRIRVASRLAISQAAIVGAGKIIGVNVYSWLLLPGLKWFAGPAIQAFNALQSLFSSSELERQTAKRELLRVPTLFLPGYSAFRDWSDAFGLGNPNQAPSNPAEFLLRAGGARLSDEASKLDELLGTQ